MNGEARERERVVNRERVIEEAVMRRPDKLGYPGARSIRNWRVALAAGRLDVGLLPLTGPKKLVLIEAKSVLARDAGCKVVGQLLMYYAGALTLGSKGLACLRNFADEKCARDTSKKALIRLADLGPTKLAWEKLSSGRLLLPHQLSLFIALDGKPSQILLAILYKLQCSHNLSIGLVIVRNRRIVDVIHKHTK